MRNRKRLPPGETNAENPQGATLAGPHGSEPLPPFTEAERRLDDEAEEWHDRYQAAVAELQEYRSTGVRPVQALTEAERRLLAQVPPQPSSVPHVVQLLVTFDGAASRVVVTRLPGDRPYTVALGGDVIAAGRSWGDVEQALEAACLESQGRTP